MRHVKLENCIFSFFLFLCGAVFHFSRRATTKALLEKQKVEPYNWVPYKTITQQNLAEFQAVNQK